MLAHQPLDRVFQALSDPSRRTIVERLSQGDASVSELARPLAMSLAAVVQHVQLLEASGLIRTEKVGRVRNCTLDRAVLAQAEQWLTQRRAFWEDNLDRLGAVLAHRKKAAAAPPAKTPATPRRTRKPP
ncbi:MAG: metalloregulator ArsR/SmtB family transcription factor [Betaproteobacteria bacterium]